MSVITVQSHVSSGHVGNAAAEYPLRRMGFDVVAVHTALLAHHPGHGAFHGAVVPAETVRAVLDGLRAHGVFARCLGLLSGYLGSAETGHALADAWHEIRRVSTDAFYCCAPVIGDTEEGVYVAAEIPGLFRELLVPGADAVVANAFEAGVLSGIGVVDTESATRAARDISVAGPGIVIITSVPMPGREGAALGNLLYHDGGAWMAPVRKLEITAKGTGDFMSALWLGYFLTLRDPLSALAQALALTQEAVELAHATGATELPLCRIMDLPAPRPDGYSPQPI